MLHAAKVAASETYHRARASSHRHRYLVRRWGSRYARVPLSASAAGGGQSGGGGCAGGQGAQHPARRVGDLAGGTARFRHLLRAGVGHHRSQRGTAEPTRPVFLVQLAFFAADGGLVPYTLATKWQAGAMPALLFAVAMGLHIFATDHVLAEHFPVRLTGRWRFALAGGALTGWARRRRRPAHRNSADQHIDRVSRWRDPAERLHRRAAAGAAFQLWLVRVGSGRLHTSADLRNGRR